MDRQQPSAPAGAAPAKLEGSKKAVVRDPSGEEGGFQSLENSGAKFMRLSEMDLLELIQSGEYHLVQRKDDWNRDDILFKREDGDPAKIENYPYRINQLPSYIFDRLLREGTLRPDGKDQEGGTIFRVSGGRHKPLGPAA